MLALMFSGPVFLSAKLGMPVNLRVLWELQGQGFSYTLQGPASVRTAAVDDAPLLRRGRRGQMSTVQQKKEKRKTSQNQHFVFVFPYVLVAGSYVMRRMYRTSRRPAGLGAKPPLASLSHPPLLSPEPAVAPPDHIPAVHPTPPLPPLSENHVTSCSATAKRSKNKINWRGT